MKQITLYNFEHSDSKFKKSSRWFLECLLPCLLVWVTFQYIAYTIPSIVLEHYHIKGIDIHSSLDMKIPFISWFICFYFPSITLWLIMPFIIYGVYGRKRFYKYFAASTLFSLVCALIYILLPTEAWLQRNEVLTTNISERTNFFDRMVFTQYRGSAPYGESPSGHWGNSILFILATRPLAGSKKIKTQRVVFGLWFVFAVFVCASTLFLKQHNIIDGPNTIVMVGIIWFFMSHSVLPTKCNAFFSKINVALGIEAPNTNQVSRSQKHRFYSFKTIIYWSLFVLVIIYGIFIFWNISFSGLTGLHIPDFIVPAYQTPSYTNQTIYVVQDSWSTTW